MTDKTDKPNDLSYGVKTPISLVPPIFIKEVAKCMEDGAKKRAPYNWRTSKISAMQTIDKILRHTLAYLDGYDTTDDSGLSNLASAAADIAVLLDARRHGVLVDDRPSICVGGEEIGHSTPAGPLQRESILPKALQTSAAQQKYLKHLYPESYACKKKLCLCNFKHHFKAKRGKK